MSNDSLTRKEDETDYPSPEQPDSSKSGSRFVSAEQRMRKKEDNRRQKAERKKAERNKKQGRLSKFAVFKLRKFEIDEGRLVRYIGHGRCVKIPKCVTSIAAGAFLRGSNKENRRLRKVVMHDGIKKLGAGVFSENYRLKKIIYKGTKAQWKKIDKASGRNYSDSWAFGLHKCIVYCADGIVCVN